MMPRALRGRVRTLGIHVALVAAGVTASVYVLVHERVPVPGRDTYAIKVEFAAANGVEPGLGQPVRVAGVNVGAISGLRLDRGRALVTLTIERDRLPRVYADARVGLTPITPLQDLQVDLDPGRPPARPLRDGARISLATTGVPVPLAELLSTLDADTRAFASSLLASVAEGTRGQGPNLRKALVALGPTTAQAGAVARELAGRRKELARFVHNLALVTRAASRDDDLARLVAGANRTLRAIAEQDVPLRRSLARLPGTLDTVAGSLDEAGRFSRELKPTLASLQTPVRRLPRTLRALTPFASVARGELARDIRPLVTDVVPLLRQLGPAVAALDRSSPDVITSLKGLNYGLNELAYNPKGRQLGFEDEGFLFWAPWFAHNYNSAFSAKDAHGGGARGMVLVSCQQLAGLLGLGDVFKALLGASNLCPGGKG
jgi:phospholipid/cholesterol/gamma-HCH transport system substrate-binding protein